jgi:hypothetical protein
LYQAEVEQALDLLEQVRALWQEVGGPVLVLATLEPMGTAYAALGRFDEARSVLAEGVRIAEAHGLTGFLAHLCLTRARVLLRQRAGREGREDAERALALWGSQRNPLQEAAALATVARCEAAEGKGAAARERMARVLARVTQDMDFNV